MTKKAMKGLVIAFIGGVCAPLGICQAEDKKTETEQIPLIFEILYSEPTTRSLPVLPEAYLCGNEVNVAFNEPMPYVGVRICKAAGDESVYEMTYVYEAEVCIDLSAWDKGDYVIYLETETATYKGLFSL